MSSLDEVRAEMTEKDRMEQERALNSPLLPPEGRKAMKKAIQDKADAEKTQRAVTSAASTISDKEFLAKLTEALERIKPTVAPKPPLVFEVTRARRGQDGDLLSIKRQYYDDEAKVEDVVDSLDTLLNQKMPRYEKPPEPPRQSQPPPQNQPPARQPSKEAPPKTREQLAFEGDYGVLKWKFGSKKQGNLRDAQPGENSWAVAEYDAQYDDEISRSAKGKLYEAINEGGGSTQVKIHGILMRVGLNRDGGLFNAKRADA
jgi:hypothetical protein